MKQIYIKRLVIVILLSISFAACSQFTPTSIDLFRKGMSKSEAKKWAYVPPENEFSISVPSDASTTIDISVYLMTFGNYKSTYFVAFRSDKLIYWGYPHEFARSPDPYLNEVGRMAVDKYLLTK